MEDVNCVLTSNKSYLVGAIVCMTSVLKNADIKAKVRFFILHSELDEEDIKTINRLKKIRECEINIINVKEYSGYFKNVDFTNSLIHLKGNYETLYRLLIWKILPKDVEKCFWLDSDLLVKGDLLEVSKKLPEDKLIAVVGEFYLKFNGKDYFLKNVPQYEKIEEFKNFVEDVEGYNYFNAGFLLINVKLGIEMGIFEELMKYVNKYPGIALLDQDLLNLVFSQNNKDKTIWLDLLYNCHVNSYYMANIKRKNLELNLEDAKIIHFTGDTKPWVKGNIVKDTRNEYLHKFYSEWFKYLKISPLRNKYDYYASKKVIIEKKKRDILKLNFLGISGFLRIKEIERLGIIRTKYYLLKFLPIFKVKKKGNSKSYYLMGLRMLKIKY
jgi:lipopolysaccharide biosynthesis glycosyltransferase